MMCESVKLLFTWNWRRSYKWASCIHFESQWNPVKYDLQGKIMPTETVDCIAMLNKSSFAMENNPHPLITSSQECSCTTSKAKPVCNHSFERLLIFSSYIISPWRLGWMGRGQVVTTNLRANWKFAWTFPRLSDSEVKRPKPCSKTAKNSCKLAMEYF